MSGNWDSSDYITGDRLIGDDFAPDQLKQWYSDEAEAYAQLGAKDKSTYHYDYHALNRKLGFSALNAPRFKHALGLGSAWGEEFGPIASLVDRITILEPSNAFTATEIHGVPVQYVKPNESGVLSFADGTFDLVTCFGVLHHIPNVTHVVKEIGRCLAPGGQVPAARADREHGRLD